nr:ATP-grasp domain-containing protein [Rhizomicrobium palustre]
MIIGEDTAWPIPALLARAGFAVDALMTTPAIQNSRFVRNVHITSGTRLPDQADQLIRTRGKPYDLTVASEDFTLWRIAEWERHRGRVSHCLPLVPGADRRVIHSKIGLSHALTDAGVPTPPFALAQDWEGAQRAARRLGYPVLLKKDCSEGGRGTFLCRNDEDVLRNRARFTETLLVQKYITGDEIDLSAIFLQGDLVHFSYSRFEKRISTFGPSSVRSFLPSNAAPRHVFQTLSTIGRALGIHGLTNITAIAPADGSDFQYFEVDLRPNVWADHSRYLGEDAAERIAAWYKERRVLAPAADAQATAYKPVRLANIARLSLLEIALNRHQARRHWRDPDAKLLHSILLGKAVNFFAPLGRLCVPLNMRPGVRRHLIAARLLPH